MICIDADSENNGLIANCKPVVKFVSPVVQDPGGNLLSGSWSLLRFSRLMATFCRNERPAHDYGEFSCDFGGTEAFFQVHS